MKASWTVVKNLINSAPRKKDLYLSIIDEDGNIRSANSNMQKGFELKNLRQVKTNFFDLLHPVHINHFREVIREAAQGKEQITAELFIRNKFYHPVKWQVSRLRLGRSNKPIFFCIGYSVIDTVSLQEKETVINAFVSQTPNLAWIVDEDGRLIFASNAFFGHFGINEKDSLYKKMNELVPSAVFKSLYDKHTGVFQTGKTIKTTERVRLADGSNHLSHITIFLIEKEIAGKKLVGGYAINLPDTTKLETDLREANQRLLTLSHVASDAIWEWDMQTGKIFRNNILMQMIGYHHEDSKGLSWWLRRIHPDDRNRVSDKVKEVTETNQYSWQDEYRFKCADGQYKHIRDKGFVIYENGLPVKMVGSLHDISALKELENKLANEKLQRQKEISETIIQVQEKERTRIGHELHDNVNQVLSSAMLFADMLNPGDAEQANAKKKVLEYISMAIEEIRTLSKELVVPQLKEQGLVNGIQLLTDDINLMHKIKFTFTYDLETDPLSSGKKITLFRIVQEQAKNILKHSKAKKAEIQLQGKKDAIQLVIKDNGIGFDSTHTHRGIGLSNIYERVSFYNGTVDIRTAAGKGCTVIVTLPLE
jgi:PAS domain S-box-containing protein